MNRHVNAIAGRLSLRPPQRRSLEILDRITEIVPPRKAADLDAALAVIRSDFPTVTDFEREFPSLCFALATGVGKTRLMGAFISWQLYWNGNLSGGSSRRKGSSRFSTSGARTTRNISRISLRKPPTAYTCWNRKRPTR